MATLLAKQVAIVTGGGRGLGRASAEMLAALGASVVVASRNAPELDDLVRAIRRAGGHALAQTADVADDRQVQELVRATERWVGPATILVNNAGMVDPLASLSRSDPALWLRNIAVNIGGTYLPTRAILPGMLERGAGRIVNISAAAASRPSAGWTAFAASKAGVEQLTRALAVELEGTGVTVCSYDPGPMDTDMQERIRRAPSTEFPSADESRRLQREGRLIDPKAAGRAVAYLALPTTSRNGETLRYDDADFERSVAASFPG